MENIHTGIQMLLMLCGDIETNPGPSSTKNLMLLMQNCRGLNSNVKLKQIMKEKSRLVKTNPFILALQETYLVEEGPISWCGNYVFSKAESTHSAGCITFLPDTVRIVEKRDIDDKGHGHLAVVEGLGNGVTIIVNIYAPVRSLMAQQIDFYETVGTLIEELESKYVYHEPDLIIMGDFNIPFEMSMSKNGPERARAQTLSEFFTSLGLIDCWKQSDNRVTLKGGQSRLDRILFRLTGSYVETLFTDWTFTNSDHCLLRLELEMSSQHRVRSRRTVSLPTYILDIKEEKLEIAKGLEEY
jgi:exonuclease III